MGLDDAKWVSGRQAFVGERGLQRGQDVDVEENDVSEGILS